MNKIIQKNGKDYLRISENVWKIYIYITFLGGPGQEEMLGGLTAGSFEESVTLISINRYFFWHSNKSGLFCKISTH